LATARRIADTIPDHGCDRQRGGWYDVVERVLAPEQKFHRYAWHDRKAWWQQEQGILAYLILHGLTKNPDYLRYAREGSAFYNAFFLDVDSGGVYFNVLANGQPYALGTERGKGSHSMAGYHAFELAYLAAVYTNLLIRQEPMDFHFRPKPGGFRDGLLRVQPDILPVGSVKIGEVWIDGHAHNDFDPEALTVRLPKSQADIRVRVRLVPTRVRFSADVLSVEGSIAQMVLAGTLTPHDMRYIDEAMGEALDRGAKAIEIDARDLTSICAEGLRYLVFRKQRAGEDFRIAISNASAAVVESIQQSGFGEEIEIRTPNRAAQLA
jgi:anti-anti-sigma regulatory factor